MDKRLLKMLVGICCAILLSGCGERSAESADLPTAAGWSDRQELLYYGIPVRVVFQPADAELEAEIWRELRAVDDRFNDWRDDTEIAKFNEAGRGVALPVSAAFADLLAQSRRAHAVTEGAFDPTVRPLRQLWRAAESANTPPTEDEIATALASCGLRKIVGETSPLRKEEAGVSLDFGGIVKGAAVDDAVRRLRAAGVDAAMVQIGGETAVWGISKRGKPHAIAIQHPTDMQAFWTVLEDRTDGFSCATSGNYRNPVKIGDVTYYHVFDPATGLPVDTAVLSVTIVFPQTGHNAMADALATAGAVLGPQKILDIAESLGAEALVLTKSPDGDVLEHASPNFHTFRRDN